jgi:mono/diheme cytochrome c family protein
VAKSLLLGLLREIPQTAETVAQLRGLGVPDEKITLMSGVPYRGEIFGRPRHKGRLGKMTLTGTLLGLLTGVFLAAGTFLLYPIAEGGQPLVPIPTGLIILFEVTMLGTMWAAFFGLLLANRFPVTTAPLYDPHITEGYIGVAAEVDDALAAQVEQVLRSNGAQHFKRVAVAAPRDLKRILFWAALVGMAAASGAVAMLFAFSFIGIAIPTNMAEQESIAAQMGPRLPPPPGAVPVYGPVLIDGEPATAPNPASANSLQRGKVLFDTNCALCHGPKGSGDGPLNTYFKPKPSDLTSDKVQALQDSDIFLVITDGRDPMPSIAENLDPGERWDVINYMRTLKAK